ncbi:protein SIEVE ELEMENT OCCLUSION C [Arabidopsis lyrata subsp. lyrata]|uniref:protein SIEVE ELEMENT OCCLUSION C n=1 Tax=Arabidopsis lyrata subsp. lyrata TaxID=81972 RepID=UPI000A29A777|nr:protein SIEVE ELEMENT OCCLUSION C [Arabidopsis lyrata subsp. lyrata]|eukprot:XP_020889984.1 protein SIEVE ELEMENT OCCLUSION C [Arabidopsis lyrata subsp. lyrata]
MNFRSDISALNEDIIVEQLLRSHDPDGRWLDSEMLLQEVETILSFVLQDDVSMPLMTENCITNIVVSESKETLPYAITRISVQMLCPCTGESDIRTRTLVLFDLLKEYRWDAKAVLVLGVLAATYGGLLLPGHLAFCDPVAASIATLNQFPIERTKFRPWLESLSLLIKAMVDVTKCIIKFERLPFKQAKLDNNIVGETLSNIYLATYRVVKSALACMKQIPYFKQTQRATESRKAAWELSTKSRRAAGELSSLGYQLLHINTRLNKQVEDCSTQIEEKINQRLRNINSGTHQDNQDVLHLLFSLQDDLPLQQYSRQIPITELQEKVIMLLLSKPPVEPLFFLLQQLYDHPSNTNTEQNYEILWVPIPSSQKWTDEEKEIFDFYSNSLPWISVRQPWLLSSTILNFFKQEWHYGDDEAMVVVIDPNGRFVNMNAMDMVLIWGVKAYPFSVSRENELWEEHGWSMQLLLDGIHPSFETWVKEGREICIFGSENLDWVDEFVSLARKIQNLGFQLELIYLSNQRRRDERAKAMEESSILFSPTLQQLFWLRLESIERSKLKRIGIESSKSDRVLEEVTKLLDFDYGKHKGWGVIGKGSTAETVDGERMTERMRKIVRWGEYARGLGFTEAIEIAAEKPCELSQTVVVPFEEALTRRVVTCEKCKWPMKRFVAYQ